MRLFKGVISSRPGVLLMLAALAILIWLGFGTISPTNATVDLSWPNCAQLPKQGFTGGVVGVTGGLDFHINPCAGNEGREFNAYSLYANTGDPGFPRVQQKGGSPLACRSRDLLCYSYNYGYQAGLYALKQADLDDLHASFWWLDVESINSWTASIKANREDIIGMIAALGTVKFLPPAVGIYSAANQWRALVGTWQIGLPLWLGTGDTSAFSAALACNEHSFTGEPVVLTQYTVGYLDYNFRCPASSASSYF